MGIFDNKKKKDQNENVPEGQEAESSKLMNEQSEAAGKTKQNQSAESVVNPAVPASSDEVKAEAAKPLMSCVYGPIGSWRFGRSLGIDMLCTDERSCNFDCVYCRFPTPGKVTTERQEFVAISKLFDDVNAVKDKVVADWVVFAGMGEPTLATNIGEAITMVKSLLGLPVAVVTNGSFIRVKEVRKALSLADKVIIKLDAFDDKSLNEINRPSGIFSLAKMLQQWQLFRMEYKGKLAFSMTLNDINKVNMYDLQLKARLILPDQIQLTTPQNCDAMKPLSKADWDKCKQWFWNFNDVVTVYDDKPVAVEPINVEETEKRRPTKKTSAPAAKNTQPS